jgi:hypothetical protein
LTAPAERKAGDDAAKRQFAALAAIPSKTGATSASTFPGTL